MPSPSAVPALSLRTAASENVRLAASGAMNENASDCAPQSETPTMRRGSRSTTYEATTPASSSSHRPVAGTAAPSASATDG